MTKNDKRMEYITMGANEIWTNINTIYDYGIDSDEGQDAKAIILGYTAKMVVEDTNDFITHYIDAAFHGLNKPLTAAERKYVETELAPKVIAETLAELNVLEKVHEDGENAIDDIMEKLENKIKKEEKPAEEQIDPIEQIKKLTAAIEALGTSSALEAARAELIKTREAIYNKAVEELNKAMGR